MSAATADGLSAYEQERLETIKQNHAKLVELGLESDVTEIKQQAEKKRIVNEEEKKARQKRFPPPERAAPSRASKRTKGEKPEYGKEKIDKFGEELDAKAERQVRTTVSAEEKAAARAEAMEAARVMLEEAREKLRKERGDKVATAKGSGRGKKVADDGWRAEAIRRWGPRAGECETDDWEGFVASREATPAPTSPDMLLQEYYADEPWKLLVCCALMSRVSSHETKTRCIEGFFSLCPTPSDFIEQSPATVEPVIASLGLFDSRWRTLVELTTAFLERPIFAVGPEPGLKIYGMGPFCVDSYHIFGKDDRAVKPVDAALLGYVRWRDATFGKAK